MFYDHLKKLCDERGTTPTAVAKAIGISTSMTANWKKGGNPRGDTVQKLAEYFQVSTDCLLGLEAKESPAAAEDDEMTERLQELRSRPEMRMLFSLAKGATKEDVELAVAIIERMRKDDGNGA